MLLVCTLEKYRALKLLKKSKLFPHHYKATVHAAEVISNLLKEGGGEEQHVTRHWPGPDAY